VKLWDWSRNWSLVQAFQGHNHYVLSCTFNPLQQNVFATASLDKTVKVWDRSSQEVVSLVGHEKGVNCVEYASVEKKQLLVSGSDDGKLKFWEPESGSCLRTVEAHSHNVSFVSQVAQGVTLSGSEDNTLRFWSSGGECLLTLDCQLERAWCVAQLKSSELMCVGFDKGVVLFHISQPDFLEEV